MEDDFGLEIKLLSMKCSQRVSFISYSQYAAPPEGIKATARHILVKSPEEVDAVMEKLSDGALFASVAADFSTCPSKSQGGSLGSFSPGTMVGECVNICVSLVT